MDITVILISLLIYGLTCYFISTFFKDREISTGAIFALCFFLSPIIGILIGMSSKRTSLNQLESYNSLTKNKNIKSDLINRLEEFERVRSVGVKVEGLDEKIESLKLEIKDIIEKEIVSDDFSELKDSVISKSEIRSVFEKYGIADRVNQQDFIDKFIIAFPLVNDADKRTYKLILKNNYGDAVSLELKFIDHNKLGKLSKISLYK